MFGEGYCYSDLSAITPYLESPTTGPTFQFCSSLAERLGCHVVVGFPERLETREGGSVLASNSALVISPDGALKTTYRKTNLFEMDVPWAQPGTQACQSSIVFVQSNGSTLQMIRHWVCGCRLTFTSWSHSSRHLHGPEPDGSWSIHS